MEFRKLSRKFEFTETSPRFSQEEIGIKVIKKINNQEQVRKKLSNSKSLEVYVAISQKKFSCIIFDKKYDKKQNERKS